MTTIRADSPSRATKAIRPPADPLDGEMLGSSALQTANLIAHAKDARPCGGAQNILIRPITLSFTGTGRTAWCFTEPVVRTAGLVGATLQVDDQANLIRDTAALVQRFETLRIRALTLLLAGAYRTPPSSSFEDPPGTPQAALRAATALRFYRGEPAERERLNSQLRDLRALLPKEYRIDNLDTTSESQLHLLGDLASKMRWGMAPRDKEVSMLRDLLATIDSSIRALREPIECTLFSPLPDEEEIARSQLRARHEYRECIKQLAGIAEMDSWYSPSYKASGVGERAPDQDSVPFRTDYQRWQVEGLNLSRSGWRGVQEKTLSEDESPLLFPNGMVAFHAVLDWLTTRSRENDKKRNVTPTYVASQNIYFEVDHLIQDHCETHGIALVEIPPTNQKALLQAIKTHLPQVVVIAPLSNRFNLDVVDVESVIRMICSKKFAADYYHKFGNGPYVGRKMHLLIDDTAAGPLAHWTSREYGRLPDYLKIISIQSLVKFAQDGTEVTGGGVVRGFGEYALAGLERRCRSRGFVPTEVTLRRLLLCHDPEHQRVKMLRHSENAQAFAQRLERHQIEVPGFINAVAYPTLKTHPQHTLTSSALAGGGAIVNLGINLESLLTYRELRHWGGKPTWDNPRPPYELSKYLKCVAEAYAQLVIKLARIAEIELNCGTSYGLNVTRFAVYTTEWEDPAVAALDNHGFKYHGKPYIRVAVGTETPRQIETIAAVFMRANEIFASAKANGQLYELCDALFENRMNCTIVPHPEMPAPLGQGEFHRGGHGFDSDENVA